MTAAHPNDRTSAIRPERGTRVAGPHTPESGRRRPPRQVRAAAALLVVALLTGVVEAIAWLWPEVLDDVGGSAGQLAPRLVLYAVVLVVVWLFLLGRNWARWVLLLGIGVVGTASLIIEPLAWLMSGPDFGAWWRALTVRDGVAALARGVHLLAVLASVALMLHPATRRYVTGGPGELPRQ